jgi:hypothetical protein
MPLIRPETLAEYPAIFLAKQSAFGRDNEASLSAIQALNKPVPQGDTKPQNYS